MLQKTTVDGSTLEHLNKVMDDDALMDIAAMKLNAIVENGTRIKDFIDIAYLSAKIPLNKMLAGYEMKYNANPIIPIKAMVYFEYINFDEPIQMVDGLKLNWTKIAQRLKNMQDYPERLFTAL
jgi:hypothetical protein